MPGLERDLITGTAYGLHFYDSVFAVEKRAIAPPEAVATGVPTLPLTGPEAELLEKIDPSRYPLAR